MHHLERMWRRAERGVFGHDCMGGRRGGRGFGDFGEGFMGGGMGGRGFRAGRMLAAGDLRLIVLALLAEKPRHGYEIIKALEERSSGFYSPSPGVVYPTLTYLEDIGYATSESEAGRKTFSITEAGREHLEANRAVVDTALSQLDHIGRKMARVRNWFDRGEGARPAPEAADDGADWADPRETSPELRAARRELKAALAEKADASPEERKRIADILWRTVQEIRGH